ncbi:hypothetical protein cypCar_00000843, partial [Cyprinus carpio]
AEQSSSPRTGIGSDQEDSRAATMDAPEFQESFVTSGVFSVTELVQVSRSEMLLSKRHKSGSMEDDIDTSPGGEYYTSPNSPASSSRNWQEEMEGGISPTVKKTEMDSPSPQESSPRLGFTQHHRPVIAVHSGISRSPHPSSSLHFPGGPILPQTASTYFQHTAIRYPPHLSSQDPLKDLVSLACDPSNQQPSPLNGTWSVKYPSLTFLSQHCLAPPQPKPPADLPPSDSCPQVQIQHPTSADAAQLNHLPQERLNMFTIRCAAESQMINRLDTPSYTVKLNAWHDYSARIKSPYSAPGTPPANRSFVGIGSRDTGSLYQAQSWYLGN